MRRWFGITAISLLITENDNQIENISNKLIHLNNKRKKIEKMYIEKIINKYENIDNEVVFIYEPNRNPTFNSPPYVLCVISSFASWS